MQFKWDIQTLTERQEQQAKELSEKLNISPILTSQLVKQGITTESAAKRFFHPQLADLINPFLMRDMDLAVDRLNDAIGRKERIMVYGDYDVDGCTAVALVYKFLLQFYSNICYYIPDRHDEGYGVSKKSIDYAKELGISLIIILDCGIKAHEEIAYAKSVGIDFIVCDHHVPDEQLPDAIILNPKRADDAYPFKHLCGCGVGFKFMQAFAKNNGIPFSKLIPLLDLCALSIAADLVEVTDENRILAYHGLKQLNQSPSIGLQAILDICNLTDREIDMGDIMFKIGPRLNASGRMENGNEMFLDHARPFYQSATMMALNPISEENYSAFVTNHFKANHIEVTPEAINTVYRIFQGNTYYMQKTFREAFSSAVEGRPCDSTLVEGIINDLMQESGHKYSETLSRLTLPQKELLYAIAQEGHAQRITSAQFIKRHRLQSASSVQAAMRKLMEYGIVTVEQNQYYVEDQLFYRWLLHS